MTTQEKRSAMYVTLRTPAPPDTLSNPVSLHQNIYNGQNSPSGNNLQSKIPAPSDRRGLIINLKSKKEKNDVRFTINEVRFTK